MRRLLALMLLSLAYGHTPAAPISAVYTFGDSLSDSGNLFVATGGTQPPPPYFMGRASNGPVWVETFAQALGLSAAPSLLGGTNFAFAGARVGVDAGVPSLRTQANIFLGGHGGVADPNALYVVFGGGNDLRDSFRDPLHASSIISAAVTDLSAIVAGLAGSGARHFLVPNLPDLGRIPEVLGSPIPGASAFATGATMLFNTGLENALAALAPGLEIDRLNLFALFNDVIGRPAAFGLTDVTTPCFDGRNVCSNPGEHLFWDLIHPTAAGHLLIAQAALLALPEPGTLVLLAMGFAAFWFTRRKRASLIIRCGWGGSCFSKKWQACAAYRANTITRPAQSSACSAVRG